MIRLSSEYEHISVSNRNSERQSVVGQCQGLHRPSTLQGAKPDLRNPDAFERTQGESSIIESNDELLDFSWVPDQGSWRSNSWNTNDLWQIGFDDVHPAGYTVTER